MGNVTFNHDRKFDFQLSAALIEERQLASIFEGSRLEILPGAKFELKTETYQWRRTGNIAIEYQCKGKPSGISTTEADFWIHQIRDDEGQTLLYFMFPIEQLKRLCREAYRRGDYRLGGGDRGEFDVILLSVRDMVSWLFRMN